MFPRISAASVIHDFLYQYEGNITLEDGRAINLHRQQADAVLCFEGMADLFADKGEQDIVFGILRAFGDRWH